MVIILAGVSGCGKTTIGKELSRRIACLFLDGDDFHSQANIRKMSSGVALTEADRLPWLHELHQKIEQCLDSGENMVLACSALSRQSRDILRAGNDDVRIVYLQGNKELIRQRLNERKGHFVGSEMLDSQFEALEEPRTATVVCVKQTPNEVIAQIMAELRLTK